jgi:hypothetical protein
MRRLVSLVSVVVLGLVVVLVGSRTQVAAQEATPMVTVAEEITAEQTTFGFLEVVPTTPLSIDYFRVVMPPGTEISGPRGDPGSGRTSSSPAP